MSATVTRPETRDKTARQPPYAVVLLNDDEHSVDFVVGVLRKVFGYPPEKGLELAMQVHETGRAVVWTGALEPAELKKEQLQSFREARVPSGLVIPYPLGVDLEPLA